MFLYVKDVKGYVDEKYIYNPEHKAFYSVEGELYYNHEAISDNIEILMNISNTIDIEGEIADSIAELCIDISIDAPIYCRRLRLYYMGLVDEVDAYGSALREARMFSFVDGYDLIAILPWTWGKSRSEIVNRSATTVFKDRDGMLSDIGDRRAHTLSIIALSLYLWGQVIRPSPSNWRRKKETTNSLEDIH